MEDTYKSHEIFFHSVTPKKLNELLHRADDKSRTLETHINTKLHESICTSRIKIDTSGVCSIYITFKDIYTKNDIGHISFHLTVDKKTKYGTKNTLGRFHAINNKDSNRKHTLKMNRVNNSLRMSVVPYPGILNNKFKECIDTALSVLNEYFNPGSDIFLSNTLTKYSSQTHPCSTIIQRTLEKHKRPLKTTRKTHKLHHSI